MRVKRWLKRTCTENLKRGVKRCPMKRCAKPHESSRFSETMSETMAVFLTETFHTPPRGWNGETVLGWWLLIGTRIPRAHARSTP